MAARLEGAQAKYSDACASLDAADAQFAQVNASTIVACFLHGCVVLVYRPPRRKLVQGSGRSRRLRCDLRAGNPRSLHGVAAFLSMTSAYCGRVYAVALLPHVLARRDNDSVLCSIRPILDGLSSPVKSTRTAYHAADVETMCIRFAAKKQTTDMWYVSCCYDLNPFNPGVIGGATAYNPASRLVHRRTTASTSPTPKSTAE